MPLKFSLKHCFFFFMLCFSGCFGPSEEVGEPEPLLQLGEGAGAVDAKVPESVPVNLEEATAQTANPCVENGVCAREGLCAPDGDRCIASRPEHCLLSESCKRFGDCGLQGEACTAMADAHCTSSQFCIDLGACVAHDGDCQYGARKDEDCVAPRGRSAVSPCGRFGRCVVQDGVCQASNDAQCQAAEICVIHGGCAESGGACVAATAGHCQKSEGCQVGGFCSLDGGDCQLKGDSDCAQTRLCQEIGVCTFWNDACVFGASEASDCGKMRGAQGVSACRGFGLCGVADGRCVAHSNAQCAASRDCAVSGHCAQDGQLCIATRPHHCENAQVCHRNGQCVLQQGTCVKP